VEKLDLCSSRVLKAACSSLTLLLFDSIRCHTGRFADCALYALSPRAGHAISAAGRRRLDELGAKYIDTILNTECPEYGSANRVAAAAHIEDTHPHDILVILDSDTLFLREPGASTLPPTWTWRSGRWIWGHVHERPHGPFDAFWRELCRCCGATTPFPGKSSSPSNRELQRRPGGGARRPGHPVQMEALLPLVYPAGSSSMPESRFRAGVGWIEPAEGK
jgi:hypothetical protein